MIELLLEKLKAISTEHKIIGGFSLYFLGKLVKVFAALHWDNFVLKRAMTELMEIKEKYLMELHDKELWVLRDRKNRLLEELGMKDLIRK